MGCTQSTAQAPNGASSGTASQDGSPPASRRGSRIAALTRPSSGQTSSVPAAQRVRSRLRSPRPWSNNTSNPTQTYWTPSSLARERQIFFETRVSGQEEVWAAIALAVDMVRGSGAGPATEGVSESRSSSARDLTAAQSVLDAAGVSVPRGRLEDGAWDERGVLYAIPPWVLADPVDLRADAEVESIDVVDEEPDDVEKDVLGDAKQKETGELIRVRARLSDQATDVVVSITEDQSVAALIKGVRDAANIKIAYLGKILKDSQSLTAQGFQPGHTVNALVFS